MIPHSRFLPVALVLPVLVALAGCGWLPTGDDDGLRVRSLVTELHGPVGTFADPWGGRLAVAVTDADGRPAAGVVVRWEADSGGFVRDDSVVTTSEGVAAAVWVFGLQPGQQRLTARTSDGARATIVADVRELKSITPDQSYYFLSTGNTMTLPVRAHASGTEGYVYPSHLRWESDDPDIVSVTDEGTLLGVREGDTWVTGRFLDASTHVRITVRP